MIERVLALDISSKTGWALILSGPDGYSLEALGQVTKIEEPKDMPYPVSFVVWAYACFSEILKLIDAHHPDVLVIEETAANSKSSHSQKILEWIHFLVAKFIRDTGIKCTYLMTGQWRTEANSRMTKDESKHNKKVKDYKDKNDTKIAYDIKGKRIGKITRKHVSVRRANELFGQFLPKPLIRKDEDKAEALLIGYAYHARKMRQLEESKKSEQV